MKNNEICGKLRKGTNFAAANLPLRPQETTMTDYDKHAEDRDISVGDDVFVRNLSLHGGKWLPRLVVECTGPLYYKVKTATHGIVRRHQDQIQTLFTIALKIRYLIRWSMRI